MFNFLSKPQVVELLQIEGRNLVFRCAKPNQAGQTVKVRVNIPGKGEGPPQTLTLPVAVQSCRSGDGPGYVCCGVVPSSEGIERFRTFLADQEAAAAKVRRSPRYKLSIRILSPELPAFRALTVDFSRHGLQLEAEGEIQIGTTMTMTVELDNPDFPASVIVRGRVVWCQKLGQKKARVGVEFMELEPRLRSDLDRFETVLEARAS